jgi:hypothetical protein
LLDDVPVQENEVGSIAPVTARLALCAGRTGRSWLPWLARRSRRPLRPWLAGRTVLSALALRTWLALRTPFAGIAFLDRPRLERGNSLIQMLKQIEHAIEIIRHLSSLS